MEACGSPFFPEVFSVWAMMVMFDLQEAAPHCSGGLT